MRLNEVTTYVVLGTNPASHRQMKVGDTVGLQLCEPGGPDFRVSVRLSRLDVDGTFEGTTVALQGRLAQFVGGSFTNPGPDLSTRHR